MWEIGRPNLIWRWAPCGALALGAVAFASFVTFAIPDHIGNVAPKSPSGSLYAATLTPAGANADDDTANGVGRSLRNNVMPAPTPRSSPMAPAPAGFPKRGFSPPLERAEPVAVQVPPPVLQQPQLNVPPPVPAVPPPAPAPQAAPVPPPQAELLPQPAPPQQSEPPPPSAESAAAPAQAAEPPTAAN
jgi:outer membrane biosynthesis protein TonB